MHFLSGESSASGQNIYQGSPIKHVFLLINKSKVFNVELNFPRYIAQIQYVPSGVAATDTSAVTWSVDVLITPVLCFFAHLYYV